MQEILPQEFCPIAGDLLVNAPTKWTFQYIRFHCYLNAQNPYQKAQVNVRFHNASYLQCHWREKYRLIFNKLVWIKWSQRCIYFILVGFFVHDIPRTKRYVVIASVMCTNLLSVARTLSYGQRYGYGYMVHTQTENSPFKWASHNSINMLYTFMDCMKTLNSAFDLTKTKL